MELVSLSRDYSLTLFSVPIESTPTAQPTAVVALNNAAKLLMKTKPTKPRLFGSFMKKLDAYLFGAFKTHHQAREDTKRDFVEKEINV